MKWRLQRGQAIVDGPVLGIVPLAEGSVAISRRGDGVGSSSGGDDRSCDIIVTADCPVGGLVL